MINDEENSGIDVGNREDEFGLLCGAINNDPVRNDQHTDVDATVTRSVMIIQLCDWSKHLSEIATFQDEK